MVGQLDVVCGRCNDCCYGDVICAYGKYYHQYCFSCSVCKQDLAKQGYFFSNGDFYCRNDYHKLMGTKCASCGKYVEGEVIAAIDSQFHLNCFGCIMCGKLFPPAVEICYDGEDFFCRECNMPRVSMESNDTKITEEMTEDNLRNGSADVSTVEDEESDSAEVSKCAGCENDIKFGQALLALDKQWHLWCFSCHKCGALLTGEYMGREGIPYCERDYQSEFGICCAGCGDYIMGKVLQAGEKHYHPSCSRCAKCGKMFGEGEDMFLQGSEIWHPQCSDDYKYSGGYENESTKSDESEFESPSPTADVECEMIPPPITQPTVQESAPVFLEKEIVEADCNSSVKADLRGDNSHNTTNKSLGKIPGFRSVKPPQPIQQELSTQSDTSEDEPPAIPPPPSKSTSSLRWQKYTSNVYSMTPFKRVDSQGSARPVSCIETTGNKLDNIASENEAPLSVSTLSLSSTGTNESDGSKISPNSAKNYKKGIGYNQLKLRKMRHENRKSFKLPTGVDPDRLRSFLEDPDHNVYLDDREFHQIFKMTREKFYALPQSKKDELKKQVLLFTTPY